MHNNALVIHAKIKGLDPESLPSTCFCKLPFSGNVTFKRSLYRCYLSLRNLRLPTHTHTHRQTDRCHGCWRGNKIH